jgi:DUF4097 and DUF4098 domain-containing protein YvlB
MTKALRYAMLAFAIVGLAFGIAQAQKSTKGSMQCRDNDGNDRLVNHCEIKEQTLPASGAITVDGKTNGGISIKGWDRQEILVRAKIETRAPTQAEADSLAQQVIIETGALNIHAEGPESRENYQWYVSYEIFVPSRSDLNLKAHNGGISISDVNGRIGFQTTNGGVSLSRVGGAVTGNTTNGGVHVELAGARWEGETLDVRTTNGGVNLVMPNNYSAHLETGTTNGNVQSDFPLNVPLTERGRMPKEISVDIGSGGPTIRAITTNGGVHLSRGGSAM